jgi:hypothetical protein
MIIADQSKNRRLNSSGHLASKVNAAGKEILNGLPVKSPMHSPM